MIQDSKISSCVDCATTIIGDRLRCPACHDQHTTGDEDATVPRSRASREASVGEALAAWLVASLIVTVVVVLMVSAGRSCQ